MNTKQIEKSVLTLFFRYSIRTGVRIALIDSIKIFKFALGYKYYINVAFFVLVLGGGSLVNRTYANGGPIAGTGSYKEDTDNKVPVLAATIFYLDRWLDSGPALAVLTAEHELLHALGYSTNYTKFKSHVVAPVNKIRKFNSKTDKTGKHIASLVGRSDHVDSTLTVNGTNQDKTLMIAERVADLESMGVFEKGILDAAYDWSNKNLNIQVRFDGPFTVKQKKHVTDAVAAAQTLFGGNKSGNKFTWAVASNKFVKKIRNQDNQMSPDGAKYLGQSFFEIYEDDLKLALTDVEILKNGDATIINDGNDEFASFNSILTGKALVTSANLGLIDTEFSFSLTGQMETVVYGKVGQSSGTFNTEILSMSFNGEIGGYFVALTEDAIAQSLGEITITPDASGGFELESYFELFPTLSFNGISNLKTSDSVLFGIQAVPIPAAAWLLGSGLLCLMGIARNKKS